MEDRFGQQDKHRLAIVRSFTVEGSLHPCCLKAENLGPPEPLRDGSGVVRQCRICHARHNRVRLNPGRLGALRGES